MRECAHGNCLKSRAGRASPAIYRGESGAARIRGFTLILLLMFLGAAFGVAIFNFYNSTQLALDNDQKTTDALARAKEALIGYAIRRGDPLAAGPRPGEFPCPDTKLPTDINYGTENGTCGGAGVALGRLPWRTLGIPEPKDANGETLWYAVGNTFRRKNDCNSLGREWCYPIRPK